MEESSELSLASAAGIDPVSLLLLRTLREAQNRTGEDENERTSTGGWAWC